MDTSNSKEEILQKLRETERKLQEVYDAGVWGITHVSAANYTFRQQEANKRLQIAMYGEFVD